MMSETLFTGMIVVFIIAYWFITQGFDDSGEREASGVAPLEDRAYTLQSLAMWAVFFGLLIIGIIITS